MAEEGLTAELLAKKFANGGSMERYMGKWLLLSMESQDTDRDAEDQFAELRQIPVIRSLFGSEKINMAEILKSWYPVGRNSVNKRLQSEQGLRVGEVVVFKASRPECLGRKSKYIAFGTRPLVSVKLMYPIATDFSSTPLTSCSSSSATSGSSSSSPPSAPSASTSTTAASNCSKMQKLGAEPPPPENQKRTSRPSLSSSTYLMFNDDVDDEAAEAAIAECTGAVGGKRRMTRSTAETKIDGEVAWERARDKETGQFYSWEDHASELQSQVHGLVKLLEATGLKLGEARAELSISDKHLHCLVSSPVLRGTQRGAEPPAPTPPPSPPPPRPRDSGAVPDAPEPHADGGEHGAQSAAGRARRVLGSHARRARVQLKCVRQQSRVRGDGGRPRARGRVRRREKVGVGAGRVP